MPTPDLSLPWSYGQEYDNPRDEVVDNQGRTVAVVWTRSCTSKLAQNARVCWKEDPAGRAQAYHLIKAANCHQPLLEALDMFLQLNPTCHRGVTSCGECAVCLGSNARALALQ